MAPIVYNRRNKKAFVAHEPEVWVHPKQQPQPHQEGEPQVTLKQTMELLRGQLASLTEEVRRIRRYHPRNNDELAKDAEIDSHSNFSNPIGQPRGGIPQEVLGPPRGKPKWESNFKIDLPEFYGSLNHEEFMDWLNQVERIFDFHEVPDSKKVKLIFIKLKGRASAWWEQLQVQRVRRGKRKIQDWCKMKQKLRNQFLPFNYTRSLYKQLHNLKQHSNAEEYIEAFYQLVARVDLNESEEKMVARFLNGLKPPIQDALSLHQLWTVFEAYNRALTFEKQLARRAFMQFQAYGDSKSTQVSAQGRPTTNSAQPFKINNVGLP